MRILTIVSLYVLTLLYSCGPEKAENTARQQSIERIKTWEKQMHGSMTLDVTIADSALDAYGDFVTKFPEDSLCGGFVYKSAEISTATGKYEQALSNYKLISFKYPKFKLAPEALFLQAALLDNYMGKEGEARMIYEQVITKYPNTMLASDARAAIQNLGKSDQELIEEFKKKNGENL
jgi:tetratricopeptide (TPR) repeat protein